MRNLRCAVTALSLVATLATGCQKDDKKPEVAPSATEGKAADPAATGDRAATDVKVDTGALAAKVGVDPGPVERKDGAAAVLAGGEGEVKKLGEETFADAKAGTALYTGDQVRTAAGGQASIVFPDESTAELAELTTVGIGSRVATADPASSAAVLVGVARFTVSARAPAEGPFLVFTPAGVVATKGTVFGVGVAAGGEARVGVEDGAVEVAGAVALDAPVTVEAASAVEVEAAGTVGAVSAWAEDDWGVWRDSAEADLKVDAAFDAHVAALDDLAVELEAGYAELAALGDASASFEAEAAADASAGDSAGYEASLPEGAATIDASFLAATRLELLTFAYAAHATAAADLYVRHPDVVVYAPAAPRISAAVLWPKRFDATAAAYFEPLRVQYYLHHPRGRLNAELVGVAVPEFYARVTPPEVPRAKVAGKLKWKAFVAPQVTATAIARPVYIAAPSVDWRAKAKIHAAPPRGKVSFWVRPPELKAKAYLGADIKARVTPVFAVVPPAPRGQLKVDWKARIGGKIKVAPPDLRAAASARARYQVGIGAPDLRAGANAKVGAKVAVPDVRVRAPEVKAGAKAKIGARVVVPDVKAKVKVAVPSVKAKVKGGVDAVGGVAGRAKAGVKAGANVKVKAPQVKIKAPSIKVKGEAKASGKLKIGN
jgi:hypothetical protein